MKRIVLIVMSCCFFAGCAQAVYKTCLVDTGIKNSRQFDVGKDDLYKFTMQTLLTKGFIIESENKADGAIAARKSIQKGKRTYVVGIQARIYSLTDKTASLFLNGVQTTEKTFIADKTRFLLFIIPLPGGGGKEATKVTEGVNTIEDQQFYDELFSLIKSNIK
ncbi:MAG: hypothetical protein HQL26_02805 [Candidatus Omnitrophica bacterium]|nr:hypothetical protein [Candidatus Omnitrophota bacterium]